MTTAPFVRVVLEREREQRSSSWLPSILLEISLVKKKPFKFIRRNIMAIKF
jgi:hypothetical protein